MKCSQCGAPINDKCRCGDEHCYGQFPLCHACYGLLVVLFTDPVKCVINPYWKALEAEHRAELKHKQAIISGEGYVQ